MANSTPIPGETGRGFPSRLECLAELLDWMEDMRPAAVSEEVWVQAKTAVVEGFTNAVRHAHAHLVPPPPVGVRILISSNALELQVEDAGAPFQPRPRTPQPDQERHWGLIMLQQLEERYGWSINYEPRQAQGNVLRIRRSLPQDDPPEPFLSTAP